MLSEETIKQIFFYCDEKRPDAILADEVDIVQFARKVDAFTAIEHAREEHGRCVKIVRDLNPEVARVLERQRPR